MLSRAKNKTRLISSSATNGRQLALPQQVEDHGFCVIERGLEPSVLRRLQDAFHQHLAAPRRQWEASQTGTDATCTGEAPPRILGLPDDWLLLDKLPSIHQSFRLWQSSWALTSSSRSVQECFTRCYPSSEPTLSAEQPQQVDGCTTQAARGYIDWHCDYPTPGAWLWTAATPHRRQALDYATV
jgi:hypothetical protein